MLFFSSKICAVFANPLSGSFLKQSIDTQSAIVPTAPRAEPQIAAADGAPDFAVGSGDSVGFGVCVGSGKLVSLNLCACRRGRFIWPASFGACAGSGGFDSFVRARNSQKKKSIYGSF